MALVACKECQEQVSDQALKCPKCGAQLKKPKRSLFGKLCLWIFVGFNLLMAFWLFGGVSSNVDKMQGMSSSAEQAGAAIGTGIGAAIIISLWVAGAVILGLFALLTRPKSA